MKQAHSGGTQVVWKEHAEQGLSRTSSIGLPGGRDGVRRPEPGRGDMLRWKDGLTHISRETISEYCRRVGLAEQAVQRIQSMRTSGDPSWAPPACGQTAERFVSEKMGCVLRRSGSASELANMLQFEADPQVLEYWSQPGPIKLGYEVDDAVRCSIWTTPEFFILERSGCGWVECKQESHLRRWAEKAPNRYQQQRNGAWRCPPGEELAATFGFFYRVRSL